MHPSLMFLFFFLFQPIGGMCKLLHLTFHKGCANEIEQVCKKLGLELDTWWVPSLPPRFFDGVSEGNVLYNMGHDRALRIWNLHKETFESYEGIITSDTAPLSRIFLQNGFSKPLIVWICCRFDYFDGESLDCDFPDPEYYTLFNEAKFQPNVALAAYTRFEHEYARRKGIDTGMEIITPCAPGIDPFETKSPLAKEIDGQETFFLFPYQNEIRFTDAVRELKMMEIPFYTGRYNTPFDLNRFKAIIHFPYAWSNLSLFENIALGIPYLLPSPSFVKELLQEGSYWHTESALLSDEDRFDLSEWYQTDRKELFVYFDSWEDLERKIRCSDFRALREKILLYAEENQKAMLKKWVQIFSRFFNLEQDPFSQKEETSPLQAPSSTASIF